MTQNYIERYWRDATPEDAIKEPPMVARFLSGKSEWFIGKLCGCWRDLHGDNPKWGDGSGLCHTTCQVYDAPDPGEGWRLIDISTESHEAEKEFWHVGQHRWIGVSASEKFFGDLVYRRRITPAVTYVPFTWDDREQLRGRWIGSNDGRCQRSINTMHNDNGIFYLCAINAELLCTDWHFLDTGKPVGKEVVQ